MIYLEGFRWFHKGNKGHLRQRTAKLLAVKVGSVKEKFAAPSITAEVCASASAQVRVR